MRVIFARVSIKIRHKFSIDCDCNCNRVLMKCNITHSIYQILSKLVSAWLIWPDFITLLLHFIKNKIKPISWLISLKKLKKKKKKTHRTELKPLHQNKFDKIKEWNLARTRIKRTTTTNRAHMHAILIVDRSGAECILHSEMFTFSIVAVIIFCFAFFFIYFVVVVVALVRSYNWTAFNSNGLSTFANFAFKRTQFLPLSLSLTHTNPREHWLVGLSACFTFFSLFFSWLFYAVLYFWQIEFNTRTHKKK